MENSKKINLFRDKEFEELDWLNRAIEPYMFPLNDVISAVPDKFDITFDTLISIARNNGGHLNISMSNFIDYYIDPQQTLTQLEKMALAYILEVRFAPGTMVDLENQTISGSIELVKLKPQFDDEDIKTNIVNRIRMIVYSSPTYANAAISRLNEVMDLLNCSDMRNSRSPRYKIEAIVKAMNVIVLEDKWRIRNTELFIKAATWIKDYIEHGNLASLSNFTRLKCMTHKGNAIYSMDETI